MFSSRLPPTLTPNRLTTAVRARRARGAAILDLTVTNPTQVGLSFPSGLLAPLGGAAGLAYDPSARGLAAAREAVAADYRRRALEIDPASIFLTASTSEAYAFLFKLLCDPGDELLAPQPSYPLFEHLTRLEGVRVTPYALQAHDGWAIDLDGVARAITSRTRAVLVVSPNNPTGTCLKRHELSALAALCARHGLALVGDEVFADYPLPASRQAVGPAAGPATAFEGDGDTPDPFAPVSVLEQEIALTFGLGGLSKSVGLPQAKLGWIALRGPRALVCEAAERLDVIGDTYLSVSTPVQVAAPHLLDAGAAVRHAIQARIESNLRTLERAVAQALSCTLLPVEAGWSAVLRVPAIRPEEELVLTLLEQDGLLVMPGYFYDFHAEAYLVVSLLPQPEAFADGAARLLARVEAMVGGGS